MKYNFYDMSEFYVCDFNASLYVKNVTYFNSLLRSANTFRIFNLNACVYFSELTF